MEVGYGVAASSFVRCVVAFFPPLDPAFLSGWSVGRRSTIETPSSERIIWVRCCVCVWCSDWNRSTHIWIFEKFPIFFFWKRKRKRINSYRRPFGVYRGDLKIRSLDEIYQGWRTHGDQQHFCTRVLSKSRPAAGRKHAHRSTNQPLPIEKSFENIARRSRRAASDTSRL